MKYVIAGGGTAGWFAALFIKKIFPDASVKLIQSKEIGIVGVGEATTPKILEFLDYLDIHPLEIIPHIKGAIKNGINFENWNGDGERYMHAFDDKLVDFSIDNVFGKSCLDYYHKLLISKKLSFKDYVYQTKIAYQNKIDVYNTDWALHFDAAEMANHLETIGLSRGVQVIEDKIVGVQSDDKDFVSTIDLESGTSVDCDFVFDCTGFRREIIGKFYDTEWISFRHYMPMKKGIHFWLPPQEDVEPFTSAIALKYGWSWKIPLPHRIGSGYIYDSDYISDEEALEEAEEYYGQKLDVRRTIPFDPGRYKNLWVKNCIALGLAGSFLEPLESTSIWQTLDQLEELKHFLNELDKDLPRDLYNEMIGNSIEYKSLFVYLHYFTQRSDTDFWKEFREKNPIPKKWQHIFDKIKTGNLRFFDIGDIKTPGHFGLSSYTQVCDGLKLFENMNVDGYENISPSIEEYKSLLDEKSETVATNHTEFLRWLNENTRNKL